MSNHDDIDPLASEAGINLRFVHSPGELQPAELIILPGSKHVASDLKWMREHGFVAALEQHLRYGGQLLGICGGMQMLGGLIEDDGVEGESTQGLGWLPLSTTMQPGKTLRRVDQLSTCPANFRVTGYEIHHGESGADNHLFPFSACSDDKQIWGSYVHGLFEQGAFRKAWLNEMGFHGGDGQDQQQRTMASLDLLADTLERELAPALLQPLLTTRSLPSALPQLNMQQQ